MNSNHSGSKTTTKDTNTDTSWNKVANWYQSIPLEASSNHQTIIIPKLKELCAKYLFPEAEIIDLACGEGTITAALAAAGYQVEGFDLAKDLISLAKKNNPEIKFGIADAQDLSADFRKEHEAKFDAVVSVLALQNIRGIKKAMLNAGQMLKSHGYFIFVLNHPAFRVPKASGWIFKGNAYQNRSISKYMTEFESPITAHPGDEKSEITWSFHRPLQSYVKYLQLNGLAIVDLEEWVSAKVSEPGPRANAENTARKEIPLFMTIVAKKLN